MIFPDWGTAPDTAPEEALPLFREWAVDWENGCFALRRGEPGSRPGCRHPPAAAPSRKRSGTAHSPHTAAAGFPPDRPAQ